MVKLALKYQNESLVENEEKFRMLKLWSALEYIAEDHKKDSEELLPREDREKIVKFIMDEILEDKIKDLKDDKQVEKIKSKISSNIGNINHKNAKDKVRDLLKWSEYPLEKLDETKDKDVLDVIYQHRNCITHAGGCAKSEGKDCDHKNPKYCRESGLDLPDLNRELHRMLKSFIGKSVGIKFGYSPVIPEDIKKLYG